MGKVGFVPVRQSGSHLVLRNKEGKRVTMPRHDPLGRGLLIKIMAEAGITKEDFPKLL
jgi:predicted RNA binding protein YcfA (HicA-like mRNA interferase family)